MATLADLMIRIGVDADRVRKGASKVVQPLNRSFEKLDGVAGTAIKTMAGISSVAPLAAGAAGGVVALGASFAAAGGAAGVFGAVLGSTISDVSENATKYEDLSDKIRLYGRQMKLASKYGQEAGKYDDKRNKAMLELEARLSLLPPAEREATRGFMSMKDSWANFVDDNKPQTFGIMARGYALMNKAIARFQPLYDIGARAAGRLLDRMNRMVDGGFFERMTARAGPALDSLMSIMFNVGTVIGNVFGKMGDKQGQGMLDWIERMSSKWAEWATSTKQDTGINKFVDYMSSNGPTLITLLSNIGSAALNILAAVSPFAPITLAIATALTALIAAVPPEALTAIVAAFLAYSAALKVVAIHQAIATARQWAMNAAWLAWPGTWIIAGILALVAVIVLVATKTRFFQTVWEGVWSFMKAVGAWFAGPFANAFKQAYKFIVDGLTRMKNGFMQRFNAVKAIATSFKNHVVEKFNQVIAKGARFLQWINALPGKMRSKLSGLFSPLWTGFKSAINRVISGWNNLNFTIGGGSFMGVSIPSMTVNTPNIPMLAKGGITNGPTLAMIGEGREREVVTPLSRLPEIAGRPDTPVVVQVVPGGEIEFRRWVKKTLRVKSGNGRAGAFA